MSGNASTSTPNAQTMEYDNSFTKETPKEHSSSKTLRVRDDDFVSRFKDGFRTCKDFANEFDVDIFPNFIPIICMIIFQVNRIYPALRRDVGSKTTPFTICSYCLAIITAHILACDIKHRRQPSAPAHIWMSEPTRERLYDALLNLEVPSFLVTLLTTLVPTTDVTRTNVRFCPSAEGFTYTRYFGRVFPINMFTAIHDLTCETAGNTQRGEVIQTLQRCEMYTLTQFATHQHTIYLCNLIGTALQHHGSIHYNSKLYQAMTSLFSPTLLRSFQKRDNLAHISLSPPTYDNEFMNPYDFMLSYTPHNAREIMTVFTQISSSLKAAGLTKDIVNTYSETYSGRDVLSHMYTGYPLPSSHHSRYADISNVSVSTLTSPGTFASGIDYLQDPIVSGNDDPTQPPDASGVFSGIIRLATVAPSLSAAVNPVASDFHRFDETKHVYPRSRTFEVSSASEIVAWKPGAFGFWIESYEIDGTTIPLPNPDLGIGRENTFFAESAIPVRYTIPATSFVGGAANLPSPRIRTITARQARFPASSLMVDRTEVRINEIAYNDVVMPPNAAGLFPGLTNCINVRYPQRLFSFFGFNTVDNLTHGATDDSPPGIPVDTLFVWSYMTYTGYDSYDNTGPNYSYKRTYFITNPRTMFGTRHPLIDNEHPLAAMPVN